VIRRAWPPELAHLPACTKTGRPIPFIAEVGPDGAAHFTILDEGKARLCLEGRLCAMCSRPMGDEVAFLGDEVSLLPGGFWIEPPICERCAELATGCARTCPGSWCPAARTTSPT
jgi:hypothetical protein